MDILSIIIIGTGLAMDCFAVSIAKGVCLKKIKVRKVLRMAFLFGLFQGLMPLAGYFAGSVFSRQISAYDHWIAFILLGIIGVKMLIEGLKPIDPECEVTRHVFRWKTLFILAIATSIDALATGVIFVPFPDMIWYAVSIIGFISFMFTFAGVYIGSKFGRRLKINMELFRGIILISIGLKILIEHSI